MTRFNQDGGRSRRICSGAPNPHSAEECTDPATCVNGNGESTRRLIEAVKKAARERATPILMPIQQKPDGAHSDPVPDDQLILIDYIALLPPRKR